MLEQSLIHVPGLRAVVGPEEDAGISAEPELRVPAGLDMPGGVELQLVFLGQAELFGALPASALIVRAMHGSAV
jgi:hypothetical protein